MDRTAPIALSSFSNLMPNRRPACFFLYGAKLIRRTSSASPGSVPSVSLMFISFSILALRKCRLDVHVVNFAVLGRGHRKKLRVL